MICLISVHNCSTWEDMVAAAAATKDRQRVAECVASGMSEGQSQCLNAARCLLSALFNWPSSAASSPKLG